MGEWQGYTKETRGVYDDVLLWMQKVTNYESHGFMPKPDPDYTEENFKLYLIIRNRLIEQVRSMVERAPKTNIVKSLQFIYELNQEMFANSSHITQCNRSLKELQEKRTKEEKKEL
jgi:hypothetical protein